jgi:phenylacetate-CoA ligase
MPDYLAHMAKVAQEDLGFDVHDLETKFIHCFLGPDLSGRVRNQLEDAWGCDVFDNYGTSEIALTAFECKEKSGMHFNEDLFYLEIVDPDNDEPVSRGEAGDLVVTSLYRQYPPLIRYSTKDLARFIDYGKKCSCGSYLIRMDHFLGRSDDMVKLRGTNMYPMACQDAVTGDPRSTGQWICIAERVGEGLDARDEMTVKVEYKDENIDKEDFKAKLEQSLRTDLGVRVTVEPVPADSLASLTGFGGEGKVKRLLDNRYETV